jgi:hypothetical protein
MPVSTARLPACSGMANRSFDADTHRQGAASRAREHTSRGALSVRAGQLQRYAARATP